MEKLYEDFLDDLKVHLDKTRKIIDSDNVDKEKDPEIKDTNSNYNDGKKGIDPVFTKKLIDYIDGIFPNSGNFSSKIKFELKKIMKSNDEKQLEKANKRVRDTVYKEYMKFLDNLGKRIPKILINPK